MKRLIECVPNFSEGRDKGKIRQITNAIESVEGVRLLDVDPGEATNRTVVTFVGEPEAVKEAAFRGVAKAAEVIDMRSHKGAHPRMGATDVLPLVPVSRVSLAECAAMARELGERIATELRIPVYAYEAAALKPGRKNLAVCRRGEYEKLGERLGTEEGADYGDRAYDEKIARTGATAVGARDFLIAVNFNLNSTSTRRANAIAFDVREKGRPKRQGPKVTDPVVKDANGATVMIPGSLKGTKAIGWYIDEYKIAQVSMNITDIGATPLHKAFDEVSRAAAARGLRVTGAEIVGLVPKRVLVEAGKHYLHQQQRSAGIAESEVVRIAVKSMGLDDLRPFATREKVIEYLMEDAEPRGGALKDMTCEAFAEETSSEAPAPGGGSIAAYMGTLGAALGTMVANLSAHKPGWDEKWESFAEWAERGHELMTRLLALVDEDTAAFNRIMAVFAMPKGTAEEKSARSKALQEATLYATEVPLRTMRASAEVFPIVTAMAAEGNPNSVSDAGVGALAARAAVHGAWLNVKINAAGLKDREKAEGLVAEAGEIAAEADKAEAEVMEIVNKVIGG